MSRPHILLVVLITCFAACTARAQGGIRIIFWDYAYFGQDTWLSAYGFGYDHDMNERLSLGLQARLLLTDFEPAWSVDYRSAYHFADNTSGSFYMDPQISVFGFKLRTKT